MIEEAQHPEFVTLSEAARRLGLERHTLSKCLGPEVPRYRVGDRWIRVEWDRVLAWFRQQEVKRG